MQLNCKKRANQNTEVQLISEIGRASNFVLLIGGGWRSEFRVSIIPSLHMDEKEKQSWIHR